MFADLIEYIDEISEKAYEIIQYRISECAEIKSKDMEEEIFRTIQKDEYSEDDIIIIKNILNANSVTYDKIQEQEKIVNDLKIGNPKDKIVNLKSQIIYIDKIKKFIESSVKIANEFIKSVNEQIKVYINKKKQSDEYKKKLEILHSIPDTDSQLWKEFIAKGMEYKNVSGIMECPFCHQPLSAHANDILDSYVLFLDNKAQLELNMVENNLNSIFREIEMWNLNCNIEDEKWPDNLKTDVEAVLKKLVSIQGYLQKRIIEKNVKDITVQKTIRTAVPIPLQSQDNEKKVPPNCFPCQFLRYIPLFSLSKQR